MKEVNAARCSHKLVAQQALEHMKATIIKSEQCYKLVKRFRIRACFGRRRIDRVFYRFLFRICIMKFKFVVIIDYQMV